MPPHPAVVSGRQIVLAEEVEASPYALVKQPAVRPSRTEYAIAMSRSFAVMMEASVRAPYSS